MHGSALVVDMYKSNANISEIEVEFKNVTHYLFCADKCTYETNCMGFDYNEKRTGCSLLSCVNPNIHTPEVNGSDDSRAVYIIRDLPLSTTLARGTGIIIAYG